MGKIFQSCRDTRRMPRAAFFLCLIAICCLLAPMPSLAQERQNAGAQPSEFDRGWPRTIKHGGTTVEVYQPQVDSWEDLDLKARMALAVTFPGEKEPVYGVLTVEATTLVDRPARHVALDDVKEFKISLPSDPTKEAALVSEFKELLINDAGVISLDRLEASLAINEAQRTGRAAGLDNAAPEIIFSERPALLVYLDGAERLQAVPGTDLQRVMNTRVFLLKASDGYYLHFLDGYLTAKRLDGPADAWSVAAAAPAGAKTAEKLATEANRTDFLYGQSDEKNGKAGPPPTLKKLPDGKAPAVYVRTHPAELLVTDGAPDYQPIKGTDLLYVANTTGNIFKDTKNQHSYVLLAGRWFTARTQNGPWQYVQPKDLPKDFANIPDDSVKENVKASIPGTLQAREAAIAAQIPQTAKITFNSVHFTPVLDGPARVEPIAGTNLHYVVNSPDPIIEVAPSQWFALRDGVWFTASSMNGAWVMATAIPAAIYGIPPSSPLYYVTYVRIYQVTPTYVLVGYTPGYYGSILTPDGVVVYGTGYVYPGWCSSVWYGCPATYSMNVGMCWTPWAGWAFGFGFGWYWGDEDYGWWYPPDPWWGPYYSSGVYDNAYGGRTAWGPNGWAGTTGNIYNRWGNVQAQGRAFGGYDYVSGNQFAGAYGMAYNSHTGAVAVGRTGAVENVYTGNYAHGGRGAVVAPQAGMAATGSRVTVGNEESGRSATAGHLNVYHDGTDTRTGWIRGQDGSVGHVNDNIYAGKDGQVYKYDPNSPEHWQPVSKPSGSGLDGARSGTPEENFNRLRQSGGMSSDSLHDMRQAREGRNLGNQRASAFQQHGMEFRHSGGMGGFNGGNTPHFGGGGGGGGGGRPFIMRGGGFGRR